MTSNDPIAAFNKKKPQENLQNQVPKEKEGQPSKKVLFAVLGMSGCLALAMLWWATSQLQGQSVDPRVQAMSESLPRTVLFGFQQDAGKLPQCWLARIGEVKGNAFTIAWNGPAQMKKEGRGVGKGSGRGLLQPDSSVVIQIAEEVAQTGTGSYLPSVFGMGEQSPKQLLRLEGKFYPKQGSRSFFQGSYTERGGSFHPFTTWVLGPVPSPGCDYRSLGA